jgi:hypothetical protein
VTAVPDPVDTNAGDHIIVYYLHGNRRCATCKKLEAYSEEAVKTKFADALKDSTILWRVVNFEEKEHKHFVEDYQLYAQSLVLSKVQNGEEVDWRNLKDIWKLVGDKDTFIAYVDDELRAFMSPADKDPETPVAE